MPAPAFTLRSPGTDTPYTVYIEAPATVSAPLPAVLFMDGDDQFGAAVEAYRAGFSAAEIAPLLLVGIGYGASYTRPGNRRIRDYTPTPLATEAGSGGADAFLSFLTDTVWPELRQRYPLREDVRGLAGHSLGSLLVMHALFQRTPFFNRMLASAPSLWWDDRSVLCAGQRLQRTGQPLPAKLFLSVGEDDTESMRGDLDLLEQQLAALPFPKLEVTMRRFPERDHYNVLPDAFRAGLQWLFA
ncbi:MAG TPA: alpha/beta hydrolase-fold protein [Opitutaceae bacterium]|nr:alpha/beta hydrolase-fold protein [Opitutaceae bacterium]